MIGYKVTYIFNGNLNVIYFSCEDMARQWVDNFSGSLEEIFISTSKGD